MRLLEIEIELFDKKEKAQEEDLGITGLAQNTKSRCVIDLDLVESFWYDPPIENHEAGINIQFKSGNSIFTSSFSLDEFVILLQGGFFVDEGLFLTDQTTKECLEHIKHIRKQLP